MPQPSAPRRADIDWIRVAAFGLLIVYHVGLVYAPWDWHVHSPHTIEPLRYAALVTNPWRLTLLFLVSGVALRFMSRRLTAGAVLKARFARLAPPFLFGVLVLVPPQAWIEAMDKGSFNQGLLAWWLGEFSPQGFANGVPLNHLWFVLYIAVYSLAAGALLAAPRLLAALESGLAWLLKGWRLFLLPMAYLAFARDRLFLTYGLSNHLTTDWYNHAMSFGVFGLGFLLALNEGVWKTFERLRWPFLATAATALPYMLWLEGQSGGLAAGGLLKDSVYAIDQWATIGAVLGFASRHIRHADGPLLRYLTDAVFPCYLAHQTLLVIFAYTLEPYAMPAEVEAPLLVMLTLGGSLAVYEVVRRVDWLRPLWGLKPRVRKAAAVAAEPARAEAA